MPPASFARARNLVFAIGLAGYVLSFFHRTAPAAIAGELQREFDIPATVLGTLAAAYFYVYTLLQIPAGVLADTVGLRRLLVGGLLVAGAGSLVFALAPTWEVAAAGRALVAVGVSVAFLAVLKINATWFEARRFATLTGITMFAGNFGAVIAGAPLAWVVTYTSWRSVFVALAALSVALAAMTWWRVRDRPEMLGFAPVAPTAPERARLDWRSALVTVLRNRAIWPAFVVNLGVGGCYLAFGGLWTVPWLEHAYGYSRVTAAEHASLLLLGVAIGAVAIGAVSDRIGNRRVVMRVFTFAFAASWLPWLLHAAWPPWATLAWFFLMGLLIPGFTLTWTIAKEANRPEHSGIATSVVNTGIFLGTGVLQPLVGWAIDRGRASGDLPGAWTLGIAILAGSAAVGALASLAVREPK